MRAYYPIALVCSCALNAADAFAAGIPHVSTLVTQPALALAWLACSVASVVLPLACLGASAHLARTPAEDRRPAGACQTLAIGLAGASLADLLADAALLGSWQAAGTLSAAADALALAALLLATSRLSRPSTWQDVHDKNQPSALPASTLLYRHLRINQVTGLFEPAARAEDACVRVMAPQAFLQELPAQLARRVERQVTQPDHCSCSALGQKFFGCASVPGIAFSAAGMRACCDAGFSYYLDQERLVLVSDDPTTLSLLGMCLTQQYLQKRHPVLLLDEIFSMLTAAVPTWLDDLERSLDELEDTLTQGSRQLPQNFLAYVSDSRRCLGRLAGFYRQAGSMFEDLSESAVTIRDDEARQMLLSMANRLRRLAEEAAALKDFVAQIRLGHQERVDAQQNKVVTILTIVTTVFTPLMLVTGWFGMNFEHMDALQAPNAHLWVAVATVATATLELAFFKARRWF